jgi:hypothetical protein
VHWISRDGYAYRQPVPERPRRPERLTEGYTPVESCRISAVSFQGAGGTAPDATLCERENIDTAALVRRG